MPEDVYVSSNLPTHPNHQQYPPAIRLVLIPLSPDFSDPTISMVRYAKDQPQGFTNRIEKVAVVGVGPQPSCPLAQGSTAY